MRNIILPDIHNKIAVAEKILKDFPYDHAWFLGDYFDDFFDSEREAYAVAEWVHEKLQDPKISLLLGNHDYHYWKPNLEKCSGYTENKYRAIHTILRDSHFEQMITHAWVDGFLISHAGYSQKYLHPIKGLTPEVTTEWDTKAKADHGARKLPEIFWCGQDRSGSNLHSGILWQDWRYAKKVEGVSQIVGHTPNFRWRTNNGDYCLDTALNCVGIIDNGKFSVVDIHGNAF